jgi:hypothetical protein
VTLVRSYRATEDERARALRPHQAHGILSRLSGAARYGDRHNLIEAFELVSPGGSGIAYRNVTNEFLFEAVRKAVSQGGLLVVPGWPGHTPPRQRETGAPSAAPIPASVAEPLPMVKKERLTWFEVEVIDEMGELVAGATLLFDVDGEMRQLATGGNGVARIDGVRAQSATLRLANTKELRAKLDAQWTQGRDKEWIAPLPNVVEVWAGGGSRPFELRAQERFRLMLHPPQRVRLLDHDGTAIAGAVRTVSVGGAKYELTSDDAGWIEFPVGVDSCPETARVEWSETRDGVTRKWSVDVVLECHVGQPSAVARARLQSLGYEVDDLARAVAEFRRDHELPDEDAAGGEISPDTRDKIAEVWEGRHA